MTQLTKTGFLPFFRAPNGDPSYLLYRPVPRREADHAYLPFQLARGTIDPGETPLIAAKREAEEELGVQEKDVRRWIDAGIHTYHSTRKEPYPIHWFLAEIDAIRPTAALPVDAAELRWMSAEEILEGMTQGTVKSAYRDIFDALSATLKT